jgi:hypothetical protein
VLLGAIIGSSPGANALLAAYGAGAQLGVLLLLMARAGGGGPPVFLSTHPSSRTREEQIREWMPEAIGHYEASSHTADESVPSMNARRARRRKFRAKIFPSRREVTN